MEFLIGAGVLLGIIGIIASFVVLYMWATEPPSWSELKYFDWHEWLLLLAALPAALILLAIFVALATLIGWAVTNGGMPPTETGGTNP